MTTAAKQQESSNKIGPALAKLVEERDALSARLEQIGELSRGLAFDAAREDPQASKRMGDLAHEEMVARQRIHFLNDAVDAGERRLHAARDREQRKREREAAAALEPIVARFAAAGERRSFADLFSAWAKQLDGAIAAHIAERTDKAA